MQAQGSKKKKDDQRSSPYRDEAWAPDSKATKYQANRQTERYISTQIVSK